MAPFAVLLENFCCKLTHRGGYYLELLGAILKESLDLALAAVPKNINQDGIRSYPSSLPKVLEVHDHHILAMSTAETVLSAHLVICEADLASVTKQLDKVAHELEAHFHIAHPTIQIKTQRNSHACHLASEAVI